MAKLYVIKKDRLDEMRKELPTKIHFYKNSNYPEFLPEDLTELRGIFYSDDLVYDISKVLERGVTGKSLCKAAILLREGLNISKLLASEEAIWVYLSHGPMQCIVSKIWDFSQLKESDSEENYVLKHWFVSTPSEIMRNALASLWWGVEISKIEEPNEGEDPYRLTEILFSNYTLRVVSLAQVLRMRNVLRGILQWLYDIKKEKTEIVSLENKGKFIAKYLNQLSGIKQLSVLSHEEIYAELEKVRDVILSIKKRADVEKLTVAEIIMNQRRSL